MPDRPPIATEAALETALRDLAGAIAFPPPRGGPDLAERVRIAIETGPPRARRARWRAFTAPGHRKLRLSVALALVVLALLAAVAGAAILGVPGIRIELFGGPAPTSGAPASVPPSGNLTLGSGAGLGVLVTLDEAADSVGFEPLMPGGVGPPDAAWAWGSRLSLVWATDPALPAIGIPGAGLLVTEFHGRIGPDYYVKIAADGTLVERVEVSGRPGFWLSGRPHPIVYVDEDGRFVEETRRVVGDALIWEVDGLTFRIESALGREATIKLAESLLPGG